VLDQVLDHYGTTCACCGEANRLFLTLDHIKGDGAASRRSKGLGRSGGYPYYVALIREGFPLGYQTLCFSCNCGRARNRGVCPHQAV
jgi:hypothetical protein